MGVDSDNLRRGWDCRTCYFRTRIISFFSGYLRDRVRAHRMELSKMSGFIDYELENELKRLCREGFFGKDVKFTPFNMRSISYLQDLVQGMDGMEIYTIIRAAVKLHFGMVQKTLDELQRQQEGEKDV